MNKDKLSIAEMERLIAGLAPPELQQARRQRLRESSRRAARAEIRRVFRRRLLRRLAGSVAALVLMVAALDHMSLVLFDLTHGAGQEPAPRSGVMFTAATPPPPQLTTFAEAEAQAEPADTPDPRTEEETPQP